MSGFWASLLEMLALLIAIGGLVWVANRVWLHYVRTNFIVGIDWVLLEIVPPREVLRSPKAMELFFTNALYHHSVKGGLEEYWQGAVWFWHSLEIVSIEGQVHFYVRTPTRLKKLVETQMYAQYPQAHIKVVEDYALAIPEISPDSEYNLWGCEFALIKPEAYPIKTYVDFGLDKDPKEELKVDPLSPVIELFASIEKGEQMWMQIVVRPSKVEYHTDGTWFGAHDWVKQAKIEVQKVFEPYMTISKPDDYGRTVLGGRLPPQDEPIVKAMVRKHEKLGFDTGIRVCYVAKKEAWSMNSRRNIRLIFRQYTDPYLNGFRRINSTQADALGGGGFLGSFFMLSQKTVTRLCNRMLQNYRDRAFFQESLRETLSYKLPWPISPYIFPKYFQMETYVLNIEELATIWHFPGQILKVPTLERIESKESSPPSNLPM